MRLPVSAVVLALAVFLGVLTVASREAGEDLPDPSPTTQPSPAASEDATPSASPGPTVVIPDDWQTYEDPTGRFSLQIPPDWRRASYFSDGYPAWVQFNVPGEDEQSASHMTDGVKLDVFIFDKQNNQTLEDLIAKAEASSSQNSSQVLDVTVNGRPGTRVVWGADTSRPVDVGYIFETPTEWITVNLSPRGQREHEYIDAFDRLIIKSFVFPE